MIPEFNDYGCLPEGIYDCTMEEAAQRFGVFQSSDRRPRLWDKFIAFMREAKACGLIDAILLNGSFVTAEDEPNDIDLVVVVSSRHNFSAGFQPSEYNVLSKRQVHRRFGFDLFGRPLGVGGIPPLPGVLSASALGTGAQKGDTKNMATIKNEAQLQQAIEQIQVLCRAIDSLRADIFPKNPRNFAIMAEGPVDEIRKLQADIDAYIQHLEAAATPASN
jgi:hypothetical protein